MKENKEPGKVETIKSVGRKVKEHYPLTELDAFLNLAIALRKGKPFIPKGIYKFKSQEEANQWQIPMILGHIPDSQP